jgi:hypothetical protein
MEREEFDEFYDELPYLGNPIKIRDKKNTTYSDAEQYPVNKLVKWGSHVNLEEPSQSRNDEGWTIMQLAVRKNLDEYVESLIEGILLTFSTFYPGC